jgi:hypothetical protein
MNIPRLLNELKASNRYENQIVHIEEIPARGTVKLSSANTVQIIISLAFALPK